MLLDKLGNYTVLGRHGGLMVSALVSRSSGPGSSPDRDIVFDLG